MTWQNTAPADPNANLVRERMFSQLLEAERAAKQDALLLVDGFRKLCFQIAQQVDGEEVHRLQRAAPGWFQSYSPAQWYLFFEAGFRRKPVRPLSSENTSFEAQGRIRSLELELADVRRQLQQELQQVQRLQSTLHLPQQERGENSHSVEHPVEGHSQKPNERDKPNEREKKNRRPSKKDRPNGSKPSRDLEKDLPTISGRSDLPENEILSSLLVWQSPACPARFKRYVSEDEMRWRRQSKALYLMAAFGLSTRLEIDYWVSVSEGLKSRSGSLRDTIGEIVERGLAVGKSLTYEKGKEFKTSLLLIHLSNEGRELCSLLGWKPVESEWERLIRFHEGDRFESHTLGVLAFTVHARARGWKATVLPNVEGQAAPDVLIERLGERLYIEVEMGDREKDNKWRNLVSLQGKVAICTGTVEQRKQLSGDCRRMKLAGMATDLETLVPQRLPIEDPENFWQETW